MVFITFTTGPIVVATNGLTFEKGDPGKGDAYVIPSPCLINLETGWDFR